MQSREVVLAWVDSVNRREADAVEALYHDAVTNPDEATARRAIGQQAAGMHTRRKGRVS